MTHIYFYESDIYLSETENNDLIENSAITTNEDYLTAYKL